MKEFLKKYSIICFLLIVFIGVTFAFIIARISSGVTSDVNLISDSPDNLNFSIDKDISLNPTQFNVLEGGGGISDTAIGTATLLANSTDDLALYTYNVYFQIKNNEYIYTTEDDKPEIVLTIIDPTGEIVTNIERLNFVTVQNADGSEVKGFDITNIVGLFTISNNYEIASDSSTDATKQDWTFTVTFINLTTNQAANGGSTLDAEILLDIEEKPTLANYIINNVYTGVDGENGLYHHDGNGTYTNANQEAGDNSYRYAGGDYKIAREYQTNPDILSKLVIRDGLYYDNKFYSKSTEDLELLERTVAIKFCDDYGCDYDYLLSLIDGEYEDPVLIKFELYYEKESMKFLPGVGFSYNNNLFVPEYDEKNGQYVENQDIEVDIYNQLVKDGYLTSVFNFVCIGSNEDICPIDNLYRIIGVFDDRIKVIKFMGIGSYYWNGSNLNYNNWADSKLNNELLNGIFLDNLKPWENMIDNTNWITNSVTENSLQSVSVKDAYINEIYSASGLIPFSSKIGLMYVSDYGYAASPDFWLTPLNEYSYNQSDNYNWLASGVDEWTITTVISSDGVSNNIFNINANGNVNNIYDSSLSVRPVFYLNADVSYISGIGAYNDPYRIV